MVERSLPSNITVTNRGSFAVLRMSERRRSGNEWREVILYAYAKQKRTANWTRSIVERKEAERRA